MTIDSPRGAKPPQTTPSAIVIGAGISGLTAAFRLQQAGFAVRVLEATDRIGGKMKTARVGGFVMHTAATVLPGSYDAIRRLACDLGFGELGRVDGMIGIMRDGQLHRLRCDHLVIDGLRTKLVSGRSKLLLYRVALDALRIYNKLSYESLGGAVAFDTETATQYCQRRLNDELEDYIVGAVVRGLHTGASVVEFFFAAVNILGAGFIAHPGAIDFLVEALATRLEVATEALATSVAREGQGARVTWTHEGEEHVAEVDACVLALPPGRIPSLYAGINPRVAQILSAEIEYGTTFIGHFGLSQRPAEPAMIAMIPASEDPWLYSVVFDHHLRPALVPPGKGQLTTMWLHEWCEERLALSDEELIEQMLPSVERLVPNLREIIEVTRIDRWRPAALRGSPGYCSTIAELVELLEPSCAIQLAGDYFCSSSTNGCVVSAERAATRLIERAGLDAA